MSAVWDVLYNGFWIIFAVAFFGFIAFVFIAPWFAVVFANRHGEPWLPPTRWGFIVFGLIWIAIGVISFMGWW